jgi:hypothetical protein
VIGDINIDQLEGGVLLGGTNLTPNFFDRRIPPTPMCPGPLPHLGLASTDTINNSPQGVKSQLPLDSCPEEIYFSDLGNDDFLVEMNKKESTGLAGSPNRSLDSNNVKGGGFGSLGNLIGSGNNNKDMTDFPPLRLTIYPLDYQLLSRDDLNLLKSDSIKSAESYSHYLSNALHTILHQPGCICCKFPLHLLELLVFYTLPEYENFAEQITSKTNESLRRCRSCIEAYYKITNKDFIKEGLSHRNFIQLHIILRKLEEINIQRLESTLTSYLSSGDVHSPFLMFTLFEILIHPIWISHPKIQTKFESCLVNMLATKKMLKVSEPLSGVLACLFHPNLEISKWALKIITSSAVKFSKESQNGDFLEPLMRFSLKLGITNYLEYLDLVPKICESGYELLKEQIPFEILSGAFELKSFPILVMIIEKGNCNVQEPRANRINLRHSERLF